MIMLTKDLFQKQQNQLFDQPKEIAKEFQTIRNGDISIVTTFQRLWNIGSHTLQNSDLIHSPTSDNMDHSHQTVTQNKLLKHFKNFLMKTNHQLILGSN